jgi:peptidoglycan/xylan/chitin deacetylase (PgdA/CDA1 family)
MLSIMFHSAGLNKHRWMSEHISESLPSIAQKLDVIKKMGYKTVFMETVARDRERTGRIHLTFDDGYLDNWVHVFPILKRNRQRATIFATPEFVDPRNTVRPQEASAREAEHVAKDCCAGFLSWPEMREMQDSGLIEIQSHSLTHTWYFKGPEIIDYWRPGIATEPLGRVWMLWNEYPEFKPFYLTQAAEYESRIPYGTPIYTYGKALETKRFYPDDDDLTANLQSHVQNCGGREFFKNEDWKARLDDVVKRSGAGVGKGHYESDQEYEDRLRHELGESRRLLENHLDRRVLGLCWPGGGVTESAVRIAREVGYEYFTMPSKWKHIQRSGIYADMIPRIGALEHVCIRGKKLGKPTPREFELYLKTREGSHAHKYAFRLCQLLRLLRSMTRGVS